MSLPIHMTQSVNGLFYVPHGDFKQNILTKIIFESHGPLYSCCLHNIQIEITSFLLGVYDSNKKFTDLGRSQNSMLNSFPCDVYTKSINYKKSFICGSW